MAKRKTKEASTHFEHFVHFVKGSDEKEADRVSLEEDTRRLFRFPSSKSGDPRLPLEILKHHCLRQAKEFARTDPLPSERRMDLPLFFRGILHAQRTKNPIFMGRAPGVTLVGLGEADLGAACGHSDLHEARHGRAVEGVDPAIGDCDGGKGAHTRERKARNERGVWGRSRLHRGPKEGTRGLKARNGRGESPHINDKDATIL